MKNLMLIAILFLSLSRNALADDLNEEFQSNFSTNLESSQEVTSLKKYKIIILRGLFNNYVSSLSDVLVRLGLPIEDKKYAPWTREAQFLNGLGIETVIPPVATEGSPEKNGSALLEIIKTSKKPVIIIGHSKGGVDALYGLVKDPQVWPKVAGVINIQVPIYGTELADLFLGNKATELSLKALLLGLMGGNWAAIKTLTERNMSAFHKQNEDRVKKLVKSVPILSVATTFEVKSPLEELLLPLNEKSAFAILNRTLSSIGGIPNDGFTSVSKSCLSGTPCLILNKLDHGSLVADLEPFYTLNKPTRLKIILSFLKMLETRMH